MKSYDEIYHLYYKEILALSEKYKFIITLLHRTILAINT